MQINKSCNLIESNLFFYDFQSCYYNILKTLGWDMSEIPAENKLARNIALGKIQKGNPELSRFLIASSGNLIDFYINRNQIKENDIVVRQKDGVVLRKSLKVNDETMPLDLRGTISKMIFNLRRTSYLSVFSDGKVSVKGIRDKTIDTSYYTLFRNLNFSTRATLVRSLSAIRRIILNGDNPFWYTRENTKDGSFIISIKDLGPIKLSKSAIKTMIDINEVEKEFVWNDLVWPFAQSVLIYCQ